MANIRRLASLILMGPELRVLLSSQHISSGEVQAILRRKGIFAPTGEKRDTVPLLSSTLLTPSEFSRLVEISVSRESSPKHRIATIAMKEGPSNWAESLVNGLPEIMPTLDESSNDSYEVVRRPAPHIDGDKVKIGYAIRRRDYSKDWIQREIEFTGEVEVSRRGDSVVLEIASTHSSKETDHLNQRLVRSISQCLHADGIVVEEEATRIVFSSFSNQQRVKFFKRLSVGNQPTLSTGNIDNVEVVLDRERTDLPNDPEISWMKDIVHSMRIDGNKLNDVFLLKNETYYDYFSIDSMAVDYDFAVGTNSGKCRVTFFFAKANRSLVNEDSELTVSHSVPKYLSPSPNDEARRAVSREIETATRSLVEAEFSRILSEGSAPAAT